MCGFLTEFWFNDASNEPESNHFPELLRLSKHRGPDDTKIEVGQNFRMGFNRLAILELSDRGSQPMYSPNKRYITVFNGEIYNFKELAKLHHLDHIESNSDTEVLTSLFDKLGVVETIKVLNGMFAIMVVDTQEKQSFLIRDYAGIKPLFYGVDKDVIVAASQFNQVFKHKQFKTHLKLRPEVLKEYFAFGYMQAPNTIYSKIHQVLPGEIVQATLDGRITKSRYKKFSYKPKKNPESKTENINLQQALEKAVEGQLISDVPLATFLSGGIDSPLISAMVHKSQPNIVALTVGVEDNEMNESKEALAYAEHLGMKHSIIETKDRNILELVNQHFTYFSEPLGDYSTLPTFNITKHASKNYTVMLSGDGGDELFFGYPRMLDIVKYQKWFKIPFSVRRPIYRIAKKLLGLKSWAPYNFNTLEEWLKAKQTYIIKPYLDKIFTDLEYTKELNALYKFENGNLLAHLRNNEFYGHLQRVLAKVDRMSMANSLEVRVPFLDKNYLEAAFLYLPLKFKNNSDLKKPLKEQMQDFYPKDIIYKKKKGFTVPLNLWLREDLKSDVKQTVFGGSFYGSEHLNLNEIYNYVNEFYEGKHNSEWGVWHIYAWQKWALNQGLIT